MNGLKHMTNPRYYTNDGRPVRTKEGRKGHVHYVQDGAEKTLCTLSPVSQKTFGGITIPVLYEVTEVVDCLACVKAVEMIARRLLGDLSSTGLEKVLDTIQGLRNGDLKS